MKRVVVIGVGAQGGTIAKKLDAEPAVEEIICADYDLKATKELEKTLKKAKAVRVNAKDKREIIDISKGTDLIVNGLPPDFNMNVMDAALENRCNYQDLACGPINENISFIDTVKRELNRDEEFKKTGITGLMNTGSAPGLANIITRESLDKLDSCEKIEILVYDGVWSKKFIPFWWSPETAFGDMAAQPVVFENGKFKMVNPFNNPKMEDFRGLGKRRMVDHEHEEPVTMGLLSKHPALKGVKSVYFRYGGPALDLAEYFYKMGLLSEKPVDVNGAKVIPMELISKLTPPAPKYPDEIQAVLDEGMISEEGAFVIRLFGEKNGKKVKYENYVMAPGLTESFKKAKITHESYITGQSAFLFTKMLVNNKIKTKGVFPPELLEEKARAYFFKEAAKLDITVDEIVETKLY
ncbi:MAG: hypothetical protein DRP57_09220 [Spirochaetes bacterium]|nr:MAG: hypothetical protein DRP57_09220 [Spirochaetota bacterium]